MACILATHYLINGETRVVDDPVAYATEDAAIKAADELAVVAHDPMDPSEV
jgi:hypothetical protein